MLVKTRGIFLHYVKYSDTSIIAHIYTEAFGQQSYIISGIHGKRSRTKVNLFQPLFLLELEAFHKPNHSTIQRLKDARLAVPLTSMPFEIVKSSQSMFIAELLSKLLREEEANTDLFEFLFSSIKLLDMLEDSAHNFLIVFLFNLTRYLGIAPKEKNNPHECYFDLMSASFEQGEPVHHHFLNQEQSLHFEKLFHAEYAQFDQLVFNNRIRRELLDALIFYYKVHLEIETEFKSLNIMREIMQS